MAKSLKTPDIGGMREGEIVLFETRKPVTDPRISGGAFQAQSRVGADFVYD